MILVVGLVVLLVGVEGFLVRLFISVVWFVYLLIWVFWFVLFCSIKVLSIQSSKI